MFAASQLERVGRVLAAMERPVSLHLFPGRDPEDKLGRALSRAVGQICQVAGDRLHLHVGEGELGHELPSLQVANVRYRAVPFGPELDPFLELLLALSRRQQPAPHPDAVSVESGRDAPPGTPAPTGIEAGAPVELAGAPATSVEAPVELAGAPATSVEAPALPAVPLRPAELRVLMAPTCPVCPRVVGVVNQVAARHSSVQVEVVDVQYYAEEAAGLSAVPAVVIDGERTVVGPLEVPELLALLRQRDSQEYVVESLSSMVRSGRVRDAAALLARPAGQRALCALFPRGSMQERIGLMVAVEELLTRDRHALDGAVAGLLTLLERPDSVLRGDAADLLGRIGSPAARSALERLAGDADPDVREVALESLAALRTPS